MRLFVGIDLPPSVLRNLEALLRDLKPGARLRWSPLENLHITTKFIGEWPEVRLEELRSALRGLLPRQPFAVRLEGLGYFPNPHNPRIFWVGVKASPALAELARDTDETTAALGVAKEQRPFSPHLTLARIDDPRQKVGLLQAVAKVASVEFGEFEADRFFLYLSEPSRTGKGSVYTKLGEFQFAAE